LKAALLQITSSDQPADNLELVRGHVRQAARAGADIVLTPEVTNCVSLSRSHQRAVLSTEAEDATLAALCDEARALGLFLLIGSLAVKTDDPDGRFANRSFLIGPDGGIRARYDKIHMFDVDVSASETYRESAGFRPGNKAVTADIGDMRLGLTICYDLRFPALFRRLAQAGAHVIAVPAAFSPQTGEAHWEPLLRARAIETGAYVLAPAQCGTHRASEGRARRTYGHAMAVSPWGEVILDAGTEPGMHILEIDPAASHDARRRIPSLDHDREFSGP